MYFSLIIRFFFFFLNFSPQNFFKLRFEDHLMNGNENLDDHLKNLRLSKFETNSINNWRIFTY
jgi:hypothetical protein